MSLHRERDEENEKKQPPPAFLQHSSVTQNNSAAGTITTTSCCVENELNNQHQAQMRTMMMMMPMEETTTNQYCSSLSGGEDFLSLNREGTEDDDDESGDESWVGLDKTCHEKNKTNEEFAAGVVASFAAGVVAKTTKTKQKKKKKTKGRGSRNACRHYHNHLKGLDNDCFSIESTSTISSLEVDLSDAEEEEDDADVMPSSRRRHHRQRSAAAANLPTKSERRNSMPYSMPFPSSSPYVLGNEDHNPTRFDALSKSERYSDSLPELPADLDGSFRGTGLPSSRGGTRTAATAMMTRQRSCVFSRRSSVDGALGGMLGRNSRISASYNDLPISDKDLQVMDLLSSNIKESRWQSCTTTSTMGGNGSSTLNGCSSSGFQQQQQHQRRSSLTLSSPPKNNNKDDSPTTMLAKDVKKRLSLSSSERGKIILQQQNLPLLPPKRKPVLDSDQEEDLQGNA